MSICRDSEAADKSKRIMIMNITISNIKKYFGQQCACNVPSLTINEGELIGIVGNNGAGKTTLFRLMLDLIKADEGKITMRGVPVSQSEEWKTFTGAYIDENFLINYLTPEEYFHFIARIDNISSEMLEERLHTFDHFMNGEIIGNNKLIRDLSAGNKQKVGIIGAMLNQPKILILDEPFNFLDPSGQNIIKHLLTDYNKEHKAIILISSHNLQHTIDISNRILLLEKGELIRDTLNDHGEAVNDIKDYFTKEANL